MDIFYSSYFIYASVVLWALLFVFISYTLLYGRRRLKHHALKILSLSQLNEALENSFENPPHTFTKNNVSKIATTVLWRFTRIGLITLLLGALPTVLLFQQNMLIRSQNQLFEQQNDKIDSQTILFTTQNEMINRQLSQMKIQNDLLSTQNESFEEQNAMFSEQNTNIKSQSNLFQQQNELIDAQIRPYIRISNTSDLNKFVIRAMNRPALIDSIIIEYSIKEYGIDGFNVIDQDTMLARYIYPDATNSTANVITNNILTEEYVDSVIARKARVARYTKIVYSPIYDGLNINENRKKYIHDELYFLSRESRQWYSRAVNQRIDDDR